MLSRKHSSFVCRLNGITFVVPLPPHLRRRPPEATTADSPGKLPEAKRRSTSRRKMATSPLRSFFCRKAPRWMPRGTMAGASEAGPEIPSPTWGTSKRFSRLKFMRKMFAFAANCLKKVVAFHPKITMQHDMALAMSQ